MELTNEEKQIIEKEYNTDREKLKAMLEYGLELYKISFIKLKIDRRTVFEAYCRLLIGESACKINRDNNWHTRKLQNLLSMFKIEMPKNKIRLSKEEYEKKVKEVYDVLFS